MPKLCSMRFLALLLLLILAPAMAAPAQDDFKDVSSGDRSFDMRVREDWLPVTPPQSPHLEAVDSRRRLNFIVKRHERAGLTLEDFARKDARALLSSLSESKSMAATPGKTRGGANGYPYIQRLIYGTPSGKYSDNIYVHVVIDGGDAFYVLRAWCATEDYNDPDRGGNQGHRLLELKSGFRKAS